MQKVLVSAGAVGAAALELNNNQATEVVEAAPHGVQQRRRSQSKKEEPAALIKRGHTTAKAHHGNSAARVQNAGQVFWIVFGIIGILGLALGLGLGLGLPSDYSCLDISKASKTSCAAPTITDKASYDAFIAQKCTTITGNLDLLQVVLTQTGANAVPKMEFKDLIEIQGHLEVNRAGGTQTTEKIVFNRLVKVQGSITVAGATAGTGDAAFVEFKTPCLKETAGDIELANAQFVRSTAFGRLETTGGNDVHIERFGTKTTATFDFGKLKAIDNLVVISDSQSSKQKFKFDCDDLAITTLFDVQFPTGTCVSDTVQFTFPKADKFYVASAEIQWSKVNSGVGTFKFGSSSRNIEVANWPTGPTFIAKGSATQTPVTDKGNFCS